MADSGKKAAEPLRRKGGKIYPRVSLEDVLEYANKLVAKTHSGPLKGEMIYPGVLNTKLDSTTGQIRASALKQFGFLAGTMAGYSATPLAKQLAVAEGAERQRLLREACLKPSVFAALFKTYNGDVVSLASLRQRAGAENVHAEKVAECVNLFADSAIFAGLASRDGEGLRLIAENEMATAKEVGGEGSPDAPLDEAEQSASPNAGNAEPEPKQPAQPAVNSLPSIENPTERIAHSNGSARSVIHVNFQIDATLDTEKLAKQLELLKQYGAI